MLNRQDGKFLAMKVIGVPFHTPHWEKRVNGIEKEITLLKMLAHPNIVSYIGSDKLYVEEEEVAYIRIYMEFMPTGSIASILKEYGALPEALIRKYTRDIVIGLQYLHSQGVIHRDLKGANLLVDNEGNVKLADFGASVHLLRAPLLPTDSEVCESIKGSMYWMAPEMIKREKYGRKVDVWSLGCLLIEMAAASHPWAGITNYAELCIAVIEGQTPEVPDSLSGDFRDCVNLCLQHDKSKRPSTADLLRHPFLA